MRKIYIIVLIIALIAGGYWLVNNKNQNTFTYQENNQQISTKKQLESFEEGKQSYQIVLLYKKGCKVCKRWQRKIVPELEDTKNNTAYIEVSEEIPEYLSEKVAPEYISGVKVPYILIFKNKSYNPVFWGRINSEDRLEDLRTFLGKIE